MLALELVSQVLPCGPKNLSLNPALKLLFRKIGFKTSKKAEQQVGALYRHKMLQICLLCMECKKCCTSSRDPFKRYVEMVEKERGEEKPNSWRDLNPSYLDHEVCAQLLGTSHCLQPVELNLHLIGTTSGGKVHLNQQLYSPPGVEYPFVASPIWAILSQCSSHHSDLCFNAV